VHKLTELISAADICRSLLFGGGSSTQPTLSWVLLGDNEINQGTPVVLGFLGLVHGFRCNACSDRSLRQLPEFQLAQLIAQQPGFFVRRRLAERDHVALIGELLLTIPSFAQTEAAFSGP
jgi:hypothetical protein